MSLSRSELEYKSVFYYIKDGILPVEFTQQVQSANLIYDSTLYDGQQRFDYKIADPAVAAFGSTPVTEGRGWNSFKIPQDNTCTFTTTSGTVVTSYDLGLQNSSFNIPLERESDYIIVRDQNNDIMDRSWYGIDYTHGRIRYPSPTTPSGAVASGLTPTTVDFNFHYISTSDGWPYDQTPPELPCVALMTEKDTLESIQIGPGVEFRRDYTIHVFATDNANRLKMLNNLKEGLYNKHIPVIDFNRTGPPLEHWGVVNEDFITQVDDNGRLYDTYLTLNPGNGNILYFFNVEVFYNTSPREAMHDSSRHRGKITFSTSTFSDRDPRLVGKFNQLDEPVGGFDSLIKKSYSS